MWPCIIDVTFGGTVGLVPPLFEEKRPEGWDVIMGRKGSWTVGPPTFQTKVAPLNKHEGDR